MRTALTAGVVAVLLAAGCTSGPREAAEPAPATTARPATTTADPDDLTAAERRCADNWPTISRAELRRMKADRSIDGIFDWSGGYWVSYDKIMDIC